MIRIWQLLAGVCVGLIVMVMARPQPINYHREERKRHSTQPQPRDTEKKITKPGDDCVICMEEMSIFNMEYFPCGHAVHQSCFKAIQQHKGICPICRRKIL